MLQRSHIERKLSSSLSWRGVGRARTAALRMMCRKFVTSRMLNEACLAMCQSPLSDLVNARPNLNRTSMCKTFLLTGPHVIRDKRPRKISQPVARHSTVSARASLAGRPRTGNCEKPNCAFAHDERPQAQRNSENFRRCQSTWEAHTNSLSGNFEQRRVSSRRSCVDLHTVGVASISLSREAGGCRGLMQCMSCQCDLCAMEWNGAFKGGSRKS